MKNIKRKIETSEMMHKCRDDVDMCIKQIDNGNIDAAKYYAKQAYIICKVLNMFSYKKNVDFSTAYEELVELTNIRELFKYPAITHYITNTFI